MATETALPPAAGDLGILLGGRQLLLPASVHQSAAAARQTQTAVRRRLTLAGWIRHTPTSEDGKRRRSLRSDGKPELLGSR